jgi:hypothetical protein
MTGTTLLEALALATHAVGPHADAAVPGGDDPLRLDLPALGPGSGEAPTPAAVRVFGSMYLAAELEQAGVVPIAELLAAQRDTFNLTSYTAAAKLDDFATRQHQWYDRAGRVQLYARLFGLGPGATNDTGALTNREFGSLLASLCRALAVYARISPGAGLVAGLEAPVEKSAQMLLANIASRSLGNTLLAARRIEDQVRYAVDILRDPAICALVGARTLQQTILNILGNDAPDVQRLLDAGAAGQKVIEWLATAMARLNADAQQGPFMTLGDPVSVSATLWLNANGLASSQQQQQVLPQAA